MTLNTKKYKLKIKKRFTLHKNRKNHRRTSIKIHLNRKKHPSKRRVQGGNVQVPYMLPHDFSSIESNGKYIPSIECLKTECSKKNEKGEKTNACLNTILVIDVFRQQPEDYEQAIQIINDTFNDAEIKEIKESNKKYLTNYIGYLFTDNNTTLEPEKEQELKDLLKIINPYYYRYLIQNTSLSADVRNKILTTQMALNNLTSPADLINLFTGYVAMTDKTDNASSIENTLAMNAIFKEVSTLEENSYRYKNNRIWDITGAFEPVTIPNSNVLIGKELLDTISNTWVDGFNRPKPMIIINYLISSINTNRGNILRVEADKMPDQKERFEKQLQFLNMLGISKSLTKQFESSSNTNDITPLLDELNGYIDNNMLLRKVYTIIYLMMLTRFMRTFVTYDDQYGIYGLFANYLNNDDTMMCGSIGRDGNIDVSIEDKYKYAIIKFINENMPTFFKYYSIEALEQKQTPDCYLIVDLENHTAQTLAMRYRKASQTRVMLYIEISTYTNITNDDKEIQVDTKFLVIWLQVSEEGADDIKTECPQTYDSIYKSIYDDMEDADAKDAIQKYKDYKNQLNKINKTTQK
jgi:hypothetical protein